MKRKSILIIFYMLSISLYAQTPNYNISLLGHLSYAQSRGALSNLWGYVDSLGNEYALVGMYAGFSVVDVTDLQNPVEVYFHSGLNSKWREVKTWNKHAYVTNESGDGLAIFDLSGLPNANTISVKHYKGNNYPFLTAHSLYIDSSGKAYISGANYSKRGIIILDLTQDPESPIEIGLYDDYYIHGSYVRHDTLWGSAIYDGFFVVLDVSNPAHLITLGSHNTPGGTTHSSWLSDDSRYLFATDEISSGKLTAYDVSNISNISQVGEIASNPGSGVIPHNPFVVGDFLVLSNYAYGVAVYDVSHPKNMVEVGHYDTSPQYSGSGFNGCWGVYPYLPSGVILASDIEEGLYILSPQYKKASFIHGDVSDSSNGLKLSNVQIDILQSSKQHSTNLLGHYQIGTKKVGTYDLVYMKSGYYTNTVKQIYFYSGLDTTINVQLKADPNGIENMNASERILNCFPNPFAKSFTVSFDKEQIVHLKIYNLMGVQVFEKDVDGVSESKIYPQLSAGIYILQVNAASGKQREIKIIKAPSNN